MCDLEDNYVEIDAVCFSEKEDSSLGFGFCIDKQEYSDGMMLDEGEIHIGVSDSYWENWAEFVPGIEKARNMVKDGHYSVVRDALFAVFGHFKLSFSVNGIEKDFDYNYNVDEAIYPMIEGTYMWDEK